MHEKYHGLLDQEMLAFISQSEACYPDNAVEASLDQQRKFYDDLCAAFSKKRKAHIKRSNDYYRGRESTVPVRVYENSHREKKALVIYIHGGGFILGGLESHDSVCEDICDRSQCDVVSVDYRLAPEHTHPAAFEDCMTVLRRVSNENHCPIVIVGDSAGGNLAAAVCHAARSEKRMPDGQVLIYPALGGDTSVGSFVEHADAPMLSTADMHFYERMRSGRAVIASDPTANPLADEDFEAIVPTVAFGAEFDPLCDDADNYCERVSESGGKAVFCLEDGLVHGYLRARYMSERASNSFEKIISAVDMLAEKRWDSSVFRV